MWDDSDSFDPLDRGAASFSEDIEYVRVILPKRRVWDHWLEARWRDGDYSQLANGLTFGVCLCFAISACSLFWTAIIFAAQPAMRQQITSLPSLWGIMAFPTSLLSKWLLLKSAHAFVRAHGARRVEAVTYAGDDHG